MIVALAMLIFLIAPLVMNRFRIPGIIGLILAGMIVGPNTLGWLERDPTIVLLGTVGMLYIIFVAGLEIDLEGFKRYRSRSLTFGLLSFFIPFTLGTLLGYVLIESWMAAILLGSLLGSHTLLAYPIASRMGVAKNPAVTTVVGGTILTDTLSMLILAVVAGASQGELSAGFWAQLIISLIIFTAVVMIGVPYISRRFFRQIHGGASIDYAYVMAVLFICAVLAIFAGMEPIIGAFLAGLALNRFIMENGPLMNRIKFVGNALFIPFFLLSVGMLMDIGVMFEQPSAFVLAILIVLFVIIGKFIAAWITKRIYHYSNDELPLMFGLTIPQAAATLAATLVGYDLGLFDIAVVNGVIIMILISCMIGPSFVEKYSRNVAFAEEQMPYRRSMAPERIMIPLSNPNTMDYLLDLSFTIKSPSSEEPIFPMTVVQSNENNDDNDDNEAKVAQAEKMLGHAVIYAAGADVPVRLLTRVEDNPTIGIHRAIMDNRISTVIAGWNGSDDHSKYGLGRVMDQLVERTRQQVVVANLNQHLSLTKRIVVILPKGYDHMSGGYDAVRLTKLLANQIGARMLFIVIQDDTSTYEKWINNEKPDVEAKFVVVEKWLNIKRYYEQTLKEDDLVVILSAREGTLSWHPRLALLPKSIHKTAVKNFIVLFPQEYPVDNRGTRGTNVPTSTFAHKTYDE
nr:cation:proton antiporter [Texcoconibacillus texcoconensis]